MHSLDTQAARGLGVPGRWGKLSREKREGNRGPVDPSWGSSPPFTQRRAETLEGSSGGKQDTQNNPVAEEKVVLEEPSSSC